MEVSKQAPLGSVLVLEAYHIDVISERARVWTIPHGLVLIPEMLKRSIHIRLRLLRKGLDELADFMASGPAEQAVEVPTGKR